ncbi:hypothetical protein B0J13DRAFT_569559 [Dactylonectria estremocensis]|uniref:Uncharacterized protein n=1 Tax=Dactylonectria estremocensis TaxID=1079267 RepID=A0A9P9IGE3_9HYPO|nr:hypothetical protein B0J13DRAFT_578661 [Dactylonectria estremocensis]KAH7118699.1 hypothetical protein B0J13DRAFT_569559 [Dactylonectria estremocensis]
MATSTSTPKTKTRIETKTKTSIETKTKTSIETKTKTSIETKTKTETRTKTTTLSTSVSTTKTSSSSPTCYPHGTYNTDEDKLEKYTKEFCSTVEGTSLTTNQGLQYIYGIDTELLIFTVSWVPGCEGGKQSITESGNLCSNTMINNWRKCNNGGQGGYTIRDCVMWIYRPNIIEGSDDDDY